MPSQELERHHAIMRHVEEVDGVYQLTHWHCHVDHPRGKSKILTIKKRKRKGFCI